MSYSTQVLGPLTEAYPAGGIYSAWLSGGPIPGAPSATAELQAALAATATLCKPPLWQVPEFAAKLPPAWRNLSDGPGAVVTGQQPGFLGGPLLTLFKIATAVALAARCSAAGRPTVPVFWSGDDDDDLAEALATVGWDPQQRTLLQSTARDRLKTPATARAILADLGPGIWAGPALELMQRSVSDAALHRDLLALLQEAMDRRRAWGPGQAGLIERIFAGTDLVVIRGHDPALHRCAAPFYAGLAGREAELVTTVRERGETLARAGFHAQINERSLHRSLFRVEDGKRVSMTSSGSHEADRLRPGVMLRSLVQDWVLEPTAVVVGPGELAYLRQLDPIYAMLTVPRCPLVPRLSGWVLPDGPAAEQIVPHLRRAVLAGGAELEARSADWADQVVRPARDELARLLVAELALPQDRADALADKRARRFHKGVAALFKAEELRRQEQQTAFLPQWILPGGQRQERILGMLSALDLWGEDLIRAITAAAEAHLSQGAAGQWNEMAIMVPEGTTTT